LNNQFLTYRKYADWVSEGSKAIEASRVFIRYISILLRNGCLGLFMSKIDPNQVYCTPSLRNLSQNGRMATKLVDSFSVFIAANHYVFALLTLRNRLSMGWIIKLQVWLLFLTTE